MHDRTSLIEILLKVSSRWSVTVGSSRLARATEHHMKLVGVRHACLTVTTNTMVSCCKLEGTHRVRTHAIFLFPNPNLDLLTPKPCHF